MINFLCTKASHKSFQLWKQLKLQNSKSTSCNCLFPCIRMQLISVLNIYIVMGVFTHRKIINANIDKFNHEKKELL